MTLDHGDAEIYRKEVEFRGIRVEIRAIRTAEGKFWLTLGPIDQAVAFQLIAMGTSIQSLAGLFPGAGR